MYEFDIDGLTIQLPAFTKVKTGVMREASRLEEAEQIWYVLENTLPPKQLKALYDLPLDEFTEHVTKWTGGTKLGES